MHEDVLLLSEKFALPDKTTDTNNRWNSKISPSRISKNDSIQALSDTLTCADGKESENVVGPEK